MSAGLEIGEHIHTVPVVGAWGMQGRDSSIMPCSGEDLYVVTLTRVVVPEAERNPTMMSCMPLPMVFFRDEDRSGGGGYGNGFIALSLSGQHRYKNKINKNTTIGHIGYRHLCTWSPVMS